VREWFDNLAPRERTFVSIGGVLSILLLFWALVLAPLDSSVEELTERIETKRSQLNWMLGAAAELKAGGTVAGDVGSADQSLVVVIDRTARQAGLGKALTRNQPVGEDAIRVRLETASFDAVTGWLQQLHTSYGLAMDSASFERGPAAGTVTASLILRLPG
jgi:general secretion pathway protein M